MSERAYTAETEANLPQVVKDKFSEAKAKYPAKGSLLASSAPATKGRTYRLQWLDVNNQEIILDVRAVDGAFRVSVGNVKVAEFVPPNSPITKAGFNPLLLIGAVGLVGLVWWFKNRKK